MRPMCRLALGHVFAFPYFTFVCCDVPSGPVFTELFKVSGRIRATRDVAPISRLMPFFMAFGQARFSCTVLAAFVTAPISR